MFKASSVIVSALLVVLCVQLIQGQPHDPNPHGGGANAPVISIRTTFVPAPTVGVVTVAYIQILSDNVVLPLSSFIPLYNRTLHVLFISASYSHLYHIQPDDYSLSNSTHFGVSVTFPVSGLWIVNADHRNNYLGVETIGEVFASFTVAGAPGQSPLRFDPIREYAARTIQLVAVDANPTVIDRYDNQQGVAGQADTYVVELVLNDGRPGRIGNATAGFCNRLDLHIRVNGTDATLVPFLSAPVHFYGVHQHAGGPLIEHSVGTTIARSNDLCTPIHEGLADGLTTFTGPLRTNFLPTFAGHYLFVFQARAPSSDGNPNGRLITATFDVRTLTADSTLPGDSTNGASFLSASPLLVLALALLGVFAIRF